ncbi:MAG: type IV pilus twitching motility protein PilT [Gammaproteobacteria bacterium]|nr:type IV pilus twitching motility protein PilT [Gammaproteobacteria bacterium]
MNLAQLLKTVLEKKASDLHICAGSPPIVRIDGELQKLDSSPLTDEETFNLLNSIMTDEQKNYFKKNWEIDFAIEFEKLYRFRVNAFNQTHGPSAAFRAIPSKICTLEELQLPPILKKLADFPHGLVLITGPTGSGKTTTLAALIDLINEKENSHIITIEDPIEFVHQNKKSLINQREVGYDTRSFKAALHSSLREDPDVILVGEMRDLETIRQALTAAETGHLVFATLHTASSAKTINRIIDVFPAEEKELVRTMLSESLQAVVCQTLIKKITGGRIAAMEIMMCTPAIRNLIRENKTAQIYSNIQTGAASGMQTLDQHLTQLIHQKIISPEVAQSVAAYKLS